MKKSLADNKVNKALSPEETTVLENIGSLVQQLMAGGENTEVAQAGVVPEDEEEDPEMMLAQKESNGPTANPETKAEDRVEDPTDITEGNLSEVGKSLGLLLQLVGANKSAPAQAVQKSAPAGGDQVNIAVLQSLAEISNVMKSLANQQNQQNTAISNILDGIGFSENVQKSLDNRPKPVQNLDANGILNELTTVLKSLNGGQNVQNNNNNAWGNVRKSSHDELRDSLPAIFGIKS